MDVRSRRRYHCPGRSLLVNMDITELAKPVADLAIDGAPLYFYPHHRWHDKHLKAVRKSAADIDKVRAALTAVASRQLYDFKSCPDPQMITPAQAEALSTEGLEAVAQLMASPKMHYAFWGKKYEESSLTDGEKELLPVAQVARLIDKKIEHDKRKAEKDFERAIGMPRSSWDELSKWATAQAHLDRQVESFHAINRVHQDAAHARSQELADVQQTAESSNKSAEILEELSGRFVEFVGLAASAFKDQQAAEHRAIRTATITFRITLGIAIVATIAAISGVTQDYQNNRSNDLWQSEVSGLLRQQREHRAELERLSAEVIKLRKEVAATKQPPPEAGKRTPPAADRKN